MPRPVMLVGSVPLFSSAEVFDAAGSHLGPLIKRIPDGETGERIQFIGFLDSAFSAAAGLERRGEWLIAGKSSPLYGIAPGVPAADVSFGPLGYADAAIASYRSFLVARAAGTIAPGTRFQVSLPTPLTVMIKYAARDTLLTLWSAFERAELGELDQILAAIPHEDLAVQWDVAPEVHTVLELPDSELGQMLPFETIVSAIGRIIDHVPADVQTGCHFCYGDPGHKHIREPVDMGILVRIANGVVKAAHRPVDWVHMPVPRGRDDHGYFAPLRALQLSSNTELYLGLVHLQDGIEGARRRVAAAAAVWPEFGIATECGLGRRDPATIGMLLDLHCEIATSV